jgi:subtilisin family serine protease
MRKRNSLILLIGFLCMAFQSFEQGIGFKNYLQESPEKITPFCVPNTSETKQLLSRNSIAVIYNTPKWLFITTTPTWINNSYESGILKSFYFEFAPPVALADTSRVVHHVNDVHNGTGGLESPYTGKNVIFGVIDQGLDYNHPDFQDANGKTRVLKYWDQSKTNDATTPQPYNYGRSCDSATINAGLCTLLEESSTLHGTSVTGVGTGNGLANGSNKGMAPDANIVFVESDFTKGNWTETVFHACKYIFDVADALGRPAVINISLGTYIGSHDGNDPDTEAMEQLLDEKPGRIIVCAGGNSGTWPPYHAHGNLDSDTSFVWLLNNPANQIAPNTIFFDLWADSVDAATLNFAFGADRPSPNYGFRGKTSFRNASVIAGTPQSETIFNSNDVRIATVQMYPSFENGRFHMQVLFDNVDSTSYYYRFMTTGSGEYDLWSGSVNLGLNNMVTNLPSPAQVPEIVNYIMPDHNQKIVSAWACSEKVITVGNIKNRKGFINKNYAYYEENSLTVGKIVPASSQGPNRLLVMKPDISATGDFSLGAGPQWILADPSKKQYVDSGGYHVRNGGTSMASPVIAGIAALYLEKCPNTTWSEFKADLTGSAYSDEFTGSVPNNTYGFGKAHALNMLLGKNKLSIDENNGICLDPINLSSSEYNPITIDSMIWSTGFKGNTLSVATPGNYSAIVYYGGGCKSYTDTVTVEQNAVIPDPVIYRADTLLISDLQPNYQWNLDGTDIPLETNDTLEITPPYGAYYAYSLSVDNCRSNSNTVTVGVGLKALDDKGLIHVSPNPTSNVLKIEINEDITQIQAYDSNGKEVKLIDKGWNEYATNHLKSGTYFLTIKTTQGIYHSKFTKM